MNQFHGFLLEFGLVMSHRHAGMSQLTILLDTKKEQLPQRFVHLQERLHAHYVDQSKQIAELEHDPLVERTHAGLVRRRKKARRWVAHFSIARMA